MSRGEARPRPFRVVRLLAEAHLTLVAAGVLGLLVVAAGSFDRSTAEAAIEVGIVLSFLVGMALYWPLVWSTLVSGASRSGRGRAHGTASLLLLAMAILVGVLGLPALEGWASGERGFAPVVVWTGLVPLAASFATFRLTLLGAKLRPQRNATEGFGALTAHHRKLLVLLGVATLFEGYDRFLISLALPYIQADFSVPEARLGLSLSLIRFGALGAIVFGRLADVHGRRGLLLLTILAYTVATVATGLSQGFTMFVAFQVVANVFLLSELAIAQVVIAEEFPATFRARGQAILGAFAALGAGLAAILFPVFQETALGWRGLYFVGVVPLLFVAFLRRSLPETTRWQEARARGDTGRVRLLQFLRPPHRLRFVVLLTLSIALGTAVASSFSFASYRATHSFDWAPKHVSAMVLIAGGLGFLGWGVFGSLAERVGRRFVGVVSFTGMGLALVAYFTTSMLAPAFAFLVFSEAGAMLVLNSMGTELFPTRMRSASKSWITASGFAGGTAGLALVGTAAPWVGGIETAIAWLGVLPIVAGPAVLLLPESKGKELEELSSDEKNGEASEMVDPMRVP